MSQDYAQRMKRKAEYKEGPEARENFCSKTQNQTEFVHFVNKGYGTTSTKRLVGHRGIGLAAQSVAKLTLHHAERGLDIRALALVLQELLFSEHEIMEHLRERSASRTSGRSLKCYERSASGSLNRIRVCEASISRAFVLNQMENRAPATALLTHPR